MDENPVKISHVLKSLLRWSEVEFIEYSAEEVKEIIGYSPGRRTRAYFVKKEIIIKKS